MRKKELIEIKPKRPSQEMISTAAGEGQDTGAAHEDDTVVEEQAAGAHETENEVAPA